MNNSIAPGSSADVNVRVTALTTNPNVPAQYKTVILKKNLVNGVNTLTQEMMSATNTKYVIKYDYVLGEDITIPANCVLEFDGGRISASGNNDTITGANTGINASLVKIFNTNVTLAGTWNVTEAYPEWFGAKATSSYNAEQTTTNVQAIRKLLNTFSYIVFANSEADKAYYVDAIDESGYVFLIDKKVIISGINKNTEIKFKGSSDVPVFKYSGSNASRGGSIKNITISGNTSASRVGTGIQIEYGTKDIIIEKVDLFYFNKCIVSNTWSIRYLFVNCVVCNIGFEVGTNAYGITTNNFYNCYVNNASIIAYNIQHLLYSSFISLSADYNTLAYNIGNCENLNFKSIGFEHNVRAIQVRRSKQISFEGASIWMNPSTITKEDFHKYILIDKQNGDIDCTNIQFKNTMITVGLENTLSFTNSADVYIIDFSNNIGQQLPALTIEDFTVDFVSGVPSELIVGNPNTPIINYITHNGDRDYVFTGVRCRLAIKTGSFTFLPKFVNNNLLFIGCKYEIENSDIRATLTWRNDRTYSTGYWAYPDGFTAVSNDGTIIARRKGTTTQRPLGKAATGGILHSVIDVGFSFFDTDLGYTVYAKEINMNTGAVTWVDATGTSV